MQMIRIAGRSGFVATVVFISALLLVPSAWADGPVSVAGLAAKLSSAVVNISTTRHFGTSGEAYPLAPDGSPLQEYFDEHNPNYGLGPEAEQDARSLGSGFVISADGLIATNNHVIEGADEILVFLTDGTRLPATVVGADDKTDLAVLKVAAGRTLTYVEFGDSDSAEVGDWVMAIGNPFGLGGSVSLGIISARNRNINSGPYDSFIQTDAAINQGNSGGPLFDMDGKVVGINTAIIARSGGSLGIGFAVPGNLASPVIHQLSEFGETRRGWLGVAIQEVTDDIASSLGRADRQGALVVEVMAGSPAVGVLRDGDLILTFDGKAIETMRDLPRLVAETEVGKKVTVRALRQDVEADFEVVLGLLVDDNSVAPEIRPTPDPEPGPPDVPPVQEEEVGPASLTGIETVPLDADRRAEFSLSPELAGVVIISVEPTSDAAEKGLVPGMVIEKVNNRAVTQTADLLVIAEEARAAGRDAIAITLIDPLGRRQVVGLKLG